MSAAFTSILALLQQLLPLITAGTSGASGLVSTIVNVLETWLPLIENLTEALYTPIKNIIAELQSGGALTADQITQLEALDAQVDAAFAAASAGQDPDAP